MKNQPTLLYKIFKSNQKAYLKSRPLLCNNFRTSRLSCFNWISFQIFHAELQKLKRTPVKMNPKKKSKFQSILIILHNNRKRIIAYTNTHLIRRLFDSLILFTIKCIIFSDFYIYFDRVIQWKRMKPYFGKCLLPLTTVTH